MSDSVKKRSIVKSKRVGQAIVGAALAAAVGTPAAHAAIDITSATGGFRTADGALVDQAGSHSDYTVTFRFATTVSSISGLTIPLETPKTSIVELPPGLVGNPTAAPTCTEGQIASGPLGLESACPVDSQVGTAGPYRFGLALEFPLYNMVPPPGQPAQFAANVLGVIVKLNPRVRGNDYGISTEVSNLPEADMYHGLTATLWGVPADPAHDAQRGQIPPLSSGLPRRPLMTAPTACSGSSLTTTVRADSWATPGVFDTQLFDSDANGTPTVLQGCDLLPFDPSITVKPDSSAADGASGLAVKLKVPQNEDPDGLATAHVRKAVVTLPEGMSVSPSSAAGLGACGLAQIELGTDAAPSCPDSSRIGSVEVDTPLLEDPLKGDVLLAKQKDNPFGSLLAIYIVAEGSGVRVKLPGRVDADPVTGRLTTTFDNTPQLPFSEMRLDFRGGPRAPLATPAKCGVYNTHASITSWASSTPVELDTPMTIDRDCGPSAFAPSLIAGSREPLAGVFSPFSLSFARPDGQDVLSGVSVELPTGLLAKLKGVPLCGEAQAAAGTCGAASRVGSANVGAGPGDSPFYLNDQPVYLTGPYKGGPYGLAVVSRIVAGPFDLGTIVVRQSLRVDPTDAHVTVVSDPLPTIVEGIPLRIRSVDVQMNRESFTTTPTSCAPKAVHATFGSLGGASSRSSSRYQVGGCKGLGFSPKLRLGLTGRSRLKVGRHPGLTARLTQPARQANIKRVLVKLPRSVALDPDNANGLCEYEVAQEVQGGAVGCPKSSIVGSARAVTPLLDRPLEGKVYFVKGVRFDRTTGNRIRTLPTLLIALRGQIGLDVRAKTSVSADGRLVSKFSTVPDAALSRFALRLKGGDGGILVANSSICDRSRSAVQDLDAHNGRDVGGSTRVSAPCKTRAGSRRAR